MKSIKRTQSLILIAVLLLSVSLWSLAHWMGQSERFAIDEVYLTGAFDNLVAGDVEQRIREEISGNFFSVNLDNLRESLLALPWVSQVEIQRQWPRALALKLYEQKAIAVWNDHAYINADGVVFGDITKHKLEGLPAISGPEHTRNFLLQQLSHLHREFSRHELAFTRIELDERRSMTITLANTCQLLLGRRDIEDRLQQFFTLYQRELKPRMTELQKVDLRYSSGAAVTWKQLSANKVGGPWQSESKNV